MLEVAAGVIDGKIVTELWCMAPASASRDRFRRRPVAMAGQTTRGEAASITISRTFTKTCGAIRVPAARQSAMLNPALQPFGRCPCEAHILWEKRRRGRDLP